MDATADNARNGAAGDEDAQTCLYCANLKVLRDLLPPKRCDYCFGQIWQENEAASSDTARRLRGDSQHTHHADTPEAAREARGVSFAGRSSMIESRRRGSMIDSVSMLGSSRRSSMMGSSIGGSMLESERRESMLMEEVWAGADSFGRVSFMDSSNDSDLTIRPVVSKARYGGLSYRVASFLGLVPNDGPDGTSMNSAIGLWMSLFAASILLVIALADGFSLHQRLWYCVATYGIFLTLHPWIHADRLSGRSSSKPAEADQAAKPRTVAPQKATPLRTRRRKSAVSPGSGPLPPKYLSRVHEMEDTLAYYLSGESSWKLVRATRGGEIYELTTNKTPFAIFKIEVFITGISVAKFMAFMDSKDPRDRCVWDLNEANFEVIETFDSSEFEDDVDSAPQRHERDYKAAGQPS
ncbi:hypothetical protein ON010_g10643 [Phytophthora cinnamomi]|nr:hypothetical protein ON010_g10643 [Phytophthora cinnamomi]